MFQDNPFIYTDPDEMEPLLASFLYPDNIASANELEDFEMGGVDSQDASKGINFQAWRGFWDPLTESAYMHPVEDPDHLVYMFTLPDVIEFTFTFDQNARWVAAARTRGDTAYLYWYSTQDEDYIISPYYNLQSIRLTHDDKRPAQVDGGRSDVIFTYIKAGVRTLHWRIQRDRYLTEYSSFATVYPASMRITNFGMTTGNRLQWRIAFRRIPCDERT